MATINLTVDNFNETILSNETVIIDFWASWCQPCRRFAPTFEKASEDHPDVLFGKVNTEEQQALAAHFGVRSIPTLMVFRDQIMLFNQAGMLPAAALEDLITKVGELDMDDVRRQIAEHEHSHDHDGDHDHDHSHDHGHEH
ncbi:MAG: thioredoxin [Alphaproteobacteria bacterium]|nr:thioredoxin [Alphaproteobacteria bacterium]